MNKNQRRDWSQFTPEKAQAWGLAMYPLIVIILVVFMVVSRRQVTTDISGLFLGLTVAGSLQAAVKKRGVQNAQSNDSRDSDDDIRGSSNSALEIRDRGRPNNSDRGTDRSLRVRLSQMGKPPRRRPRLEIV